MSERAAAFRRSFPEGVEPRIEPGQFGSWFVTGRVQFGRDGAKDPGRFVILVSLGHLVERRQAGQSFHQERIAIAFAWVWFVNLYNFMDGLDALAAGQAVTAAAGALLVLALAGMPAAFAVAPPLAAGLAAGALAFLPRNWPPARVFLGDVGSIPLGYLLAWLLLALAYAGHAVPALILPLYFVFDATFTLLSRLLRGASVFDAHSEHLYQRARRGGKSHLWVTVRALAANVLFAGLAVLAVRFPFSALLAASPVLVGLAAIYLCAARTRPVSADRLGRP